MRNRKRTPKRPPEQAQAVLRPVELLSLVRARRAVAVAQLIRTRQLQRCLWRLMAHMKERELYWLHVIGSRADIEEDGDDGA